MRIEIANARERRDRSMRTRITVGVIVGALWLATLLTSDVPLLWVTLIWAAGGATFYFWARRDFVKESNARIAYLQDILRYNTAEVFCIEANAFAELRDANGEGSIYAFQIDDAHVVFVLPPAISWSRPGFPSLAFEVVRYTDASGAMLATRVARHTTRADPARVLIVGAKDEPSLDDLELVPGGHLEVVPGTVETLETALSRRGGHRDVNEP